MINIIFDKCLFTLQSQTDQSCPSDIECKQLPLSCIKCNLNYSCIYGKELMVPCNANTLQGCTVSIDQLHFLKKCILEFN